MIKIFTKTFYKVVKFVQGGFWKITKPKNVFETRNNLPGSGAKNLIVPKRSTKVNHGCGQYGQTA